VQTPPESRNAALLYYQALVCCPDLDEFPPDVVRQVYRGRANARDAKLYADKHRAVVEYVQAAARMGHCDWGVATDRAPGFRVSALARVRTLLFLVAAEAQRLAGDGDYEAAFEQIFGLRRFTAHAAADPNLGFILPFQIEGNALKFTLFMMSRTPPDCEAFARLKDQLAFDPFSPDWLPTLFHADFELVLFSLRTDEASLQRIRTVVPTNSSAAYRARQEAWNEVGDEALIERIREPYARFLDDVLDVLASDLPYAQAYERINSRVEALKEAAPDEPAIIANWVMCADGVLGQYGTLVYLAATRNALRAAVDVYKVRTRTGRLPATLPEGLPKDPFSGQDFQYETTEDGFALRCRTKDVGADRLWEYEFNVQATGGTE
jgi:hypothetical protein